MLSLLRRRARRAAAALPLSDDEGPADDVDDVPQPVVARADPFPPVVTRVAVAVEAGPQGARPSTSAEAAVPVAALVPVAVQDAGDVQPMRARSPLSWRLNQVAGPPEGELVSQRTRSARGTAPSSTSA